jgi:hypothetical protein
VESTKNKRSILSDVKIDVKLKLSALWAAVMFCYIYGDIFMFFKPGTIRDILAGSTGPLGTQGGLLAAALLMAVPSVMVFLSLALVPTVSRYANIVLGLIYTAVIIATMPGTWMFYIVLGVVEAALTLSIVWFAWTWPKQNAHLDSAGPSINS